jgi:DHA1 family bicyclomycin/chloramphenicol resistance-like MFS transporter
VLHISTTQYGLVMFAMSFVYILGTLLCRRLLPRLGIRRSVALGGVLTFAGGTSMGLLALAGVHSVAAIVGPFLLFILAHGIHQPCSQSGAVGPFPQAAGAASALAGFLIMLAAFFMGGWLGRHLDGTVFALTHGIWFWSTCIALTAWTAVQRYGDGLPVAAAQPA